MISGENKFLFEQHFEELKNKFTDLKYQIRENKEIITGMLPFSVTYHKTIEDEYKIELIISDDYPETPPIAKEIGGRIPDDFHRNKDTENSLCLGSPRAVICRFKKNPTLLHFVDQQVVLFLFSYSYYMKYGKMPYGELSHGGKGILEYYCELIRIEDYNIITKILKILAEDKYSRNKKCPCGSGIKVRKCHGKSILELNKYKTIEYDYKQVLSYWDNIGRK